MREIKFRAWDEYEKCFHYFTLTNILQYKKEFEKHIINGDKFEQFTGLYDKNGKEIYEGDIVKTGMYHKIIVIEWFEYIAGFIGWSDKREEGCYTICDEDIEVIGNIYENPELIK